MKPISAVPHGVLDYGVGLLLLVSPWLFGFNDLSSAATLTMSILGGVILLLSLCTNYPLGLVKMIPFPVHGVIEGLGALGLLASPWLMQFSELDSARNLALTVGIAYLAVIALTNYSVYQIQRPIH